MDQMDEERLKEVFRDLLGKLDGDSREDVKKYIEDSLGSSAVKDIEDSL